MTFSADAAADITAEKCVKLIDSTEFSANMNAFRPILFLKLEKGKR